MKTNLKSDKKILVIGAVVIDEVIHINKLPQTGEDVIGVHENTFVGGCAYNVQQVINYFGLANSLFTPIGKGPYSQIIREELTKKKIPLVIEDDFKDNGWNISFVEEDGERTFLTVPGIEACWKDDWFDRINLSEYDFIYLSGYELEGQSGEVITKQLLNKKAPNAKIIFDLGPRMAFISESVMKSILSAGTIVHCNKSELLTLYPDESVEKAAEKLHSLTGEAVIVTLGKDGSYILDKEKACTLAIKKVQVVDTIGAGDSHTGGFISGLAAGLTIEDACRLGNEVSVKVVQQSGGTFTG